MKTRKLILLIFLLCPLFETTCSLEGNDSAFFNFTLDSEPSTQTTLSVVNESYSVINESRSVTVMTTSTTTSTTTSPVTRGATYGENDEMCGVCRCPDPSESGTLDVDCRERKLTGIPKFPAMISTGIVGEVRMNFDSNFLSALKKFAAVPKLISITLARNTIAELDSYLIDDLERLQMLDLSYNLLTRVPKRAFASRDVTRALPLQVLNLGHNNLKTLDKDLFDNLHNLDTLSIHNNPFVSFDSATVTALNGLLNLENLDLAYTGLSALQKTLINPVSHVFTLNLAGNPLTEVPMVVRTASNLQRLNLNYVNLTALRSEDFLGLKDLVELNMTALLNLTKVQKGAFSSLPSLKKLNLSFNPKLSYIDPEAFADFGESREWHLEEVNLQYNNLTGLDKKLLPWIKVHENLNLQGNPWSCDCYSKWIRDLELNPEFTLDLKCASPENAQNQLLKNVAEKVFTVCPPSLPRESSDPSSFRSNKVTVALSVTIVVITLVAIVIVFLVFVIRKRRSFKSSLKPQVRYSKAYNMEEDT